MLSKRKKVLPVLLIVVMILTSSSISFAQNQDDNPAISLIENSDQTVDILVDNEKLDEYIRAHGEDAEIPFSYGVIDVNGEFVEKAALPSVAVVFTANQTSWSGNYIKFNIKAVANQKIKRCWGKVTVNNGSALNPYLIATGKVDLLNNAGSKTLNSTLDCYTGSVKSVRISFTGMYAQDIWGRNGSMTNYYKSSIR